MDSKTNNCINCGSNDITLDISLGKLKCNHCGATIENIMYNDRPDKEVKESEQNISKGAGSITDENINTVILKCSSCGETFYSSKNTTYPKCIWCGGELSVNQELETTSNIAEILPFTITQKEALRCIKEKFDENYIKKTVPSDIIGKINKDSLIGVYLPYKAIDATYKCDFAGKGEIEADYQSDSDSNRVTYYVDSYDIVRVFDVEAKDIFMENKDENIQDNQTAINNIITSASPFDTNDSLPLEGKYLKNYLAEVITPSNEPDSKEFANKLASVAKHAILSDILFYERGVRWDKTELSDIKADYTYIYLPVWLYLFKTQENNKIEYYYVAVNGRTKEVVNHLPYDKKVVILSSLKPALVVFFTMLLLLCWIPFAFMAEESWIKIIVYLFFFGSVCCIPIIVFFDKYKKSKGYSLGDNNLNENDGKIKTKVNKIEFTDTKGKSFSTGKSTIDSRNDNGDDVRFEQFLDESNVRFIKK